MSFGGKKANKAEAGPLKKCKVDGCENALRARGFCSGHYNSARRSGMKKILSPSVEDFIKSRVNVRDDGCWQWIGVIGSGGYGRLKFEGKSYSAHRHSYKFLVGPIPHGFQVNHLCHNRACVNPDHLYIGDQTQNMEDMRSAGRERKVRGAESPNSKLTESQAIEIIASIGSPEVISKKYGVSPTLIRAIRKGKAWSYLRN